MRDHQRRGFYRIGLLPLVAAEEVVLEVREPEFLGDLLECMQKKLRRGTEVFELRRMRITFPAAWDQTLSAKRVCFGYNGQLHLEDGVVFQRQGQQWNAAKGILQANGEKDGRLVLLSNNKPTAISLSHHKGGPP